MYWYLLKRTPSKARKDIYRIVESMGFRNVGITRKASGSAVGDFLFTLAAMFTLPFIVKKGDVVQLPYNLRKYYTYICRVTHWKGGKVVALIHDLSSFYRKHVSAEQEIKRLNHSDCLIAHNPVMKEWLEENGCKRPVVVLGVFDYLSDKEPEDKALPQPPYRVLYAGTLSPEKNKYLYLLEDYMRNYTFSLYGKGFDEERIKDKNKFSYKGFVSSDNLVASADGDFGLVWDGNSIDYLDGPRGNYMRYNNPHKFSLYIRCGLPVIVWEQAAMAPFVREYNIGFCISSLTDLDTLLPAITQEQYAEMKANTLKVSKKLADGYYFKKAFEECLTSLSAN